MIPAGRLTSMPYWVRIRTDWLQDSRIIFACIAAKTPLAALGFLAIVTKGIHTHGTYASREALIASITDRNIGISPRLAKSIAQALIEARLVLELDYGIAIAEWDRYAPPANALPPSQRRSRPEQGNG